MIKAELAHNAEPMTEHYITAEHLKQMTVIARVSGEEPGKRVWTELGIYYRHHFNRPFVAVVIGAVRDDEPTKVPKFRSFAAGTLDRAAGWFQGSMLTDQLLRALPDLSAEEAARFYPDHNQMKHEARTLRDGGQGYIDPVKDRRAAELREESGIEPFATSRIPVMAPGETLVLTPREPFKTLTEALGWLYPGADTAGAMSTLMEMDFRMPARTVRRALAIDAGAEGEQGAWVGMFLASMQFFDRGAWRRQRSEEKAGPPAEDVATIANDKG